MFLTTSNLLMFWIKVKGKYSEIATKSKEKPASISNILFVKQEFSVVTATKTRLQSRLDISNVSVSMTLNTPRWDCIVGGKQAQGSHEFYIMLRCLTISLYITM